MASTNRKSARKESPGLQELLVLELQAIHNAENQLSKILPRVAKSIATEKLRPAVEQRVAEGEERGGSGGAERMAKDYGTELLGQLPLDESIRSQADSGKPTVVSEPDGPLAAIYRKIARRAAVKIAESQKDMTARFPNIVVQNT